jgi:hypothetical protein
MNRYSIEIIVRENGQETARKTFEHPAPAEANSRDELIWGALYGFGGVGAVKYLESLAPAWQPPADEAPHVDV